MKPYFIFSDECGAYEKRRDDKFCIAHPFYVRSNVLVSMDDFIVLTDRINTLKREYDIPLGRELKWQDYGISIKRNDKRKKPYLSHLTSENI